MSLFHHWPILTVPAWDTRNRELVSIRSVHQCTLIVLTHSGHTPGQARQSTQWLGHFDAPVSSL